MGAYGSEKPVKDGGKTRGGPGRGRGRGEGRGTGAPPSSGDNHGVVLYLPFGTRPPALHPPAPAVPRQFTRSSPAVPPPCKIPIPAALARYRFPKQDSVP